MKLVEYVQEHAVRGECTCGHCVDAPENPEHHQPAGDTVDLTFFRVAAKDADKDVFLNLVKEEFPKYLDGEEHNYLEVGGDLGDQGVALMMIGLGHLLKVWSVLCPETLMPFLPSELKQQMAGMGMVSLQAGKDQHDTGRKGGSCQCVCGKGHNSCSGHAG